MARRSRVLGDFKLRRLLRTIHKTMDNELKPAMQEGADKILADMQRLAPKDSGAGAAALTAFVAKSGLDAQIGLRGKKANREFYYLKYIEYGTKGVSGEKRANGRRRRNTNKSDGAHWFGKYPDIPARPAHPFIRPAYDLNRDEMVALIRQAIASTLARAAGGGP